MALDYLELIKLIEFPVQNEVVAGESWFVITGPDGIGRRISESKLKEYMEGKTNFSMDDFYEGYIDAQRKPYIFEKGEKDIIVTDNGSFTLIPETQVGHFIFVGEVDELRGFGYALPGREIKHTNHTGRDIIIRDKYAGPSNTGYDFGGSDYTFVNGSTITFKSNGGFWQLAPNNQVAFSDHLDSVNAQVSVGSDGMEVITGIYDKINSKYVSFKETDEDKPVDGIIFLNYNGNKFVNTSYLETKTVYASQFGAKGLSSTVDVPAFEKALKYERLILDSVTDYKLGSQTYDLKSNTEITGGENTKITGGVLNISGEKSSTSTNISVTAEKSDYEITVSSVSGISIDDWIEIVQSTSYYENVNNKPPAELNRVKSISGNIITLHYPLAHLYPSGLATPSEVHKLNSIIENVTISNLVLDGGLRMQYCRNVKLKNIRLKNNRAVNNGTDIGSCMDISVDITSDENNPQLSSPNALLFLYNIRNLFAKVSLENSPKDGVRIWGCSNVYLDAKIENGKSRAINIYNSDVVYLDRPNIQGDIIQDGNTETILVNFSRNVVIYEPYIHEINKGGDVSYIEFRGRSENVRLIGGEIYTYNFTAITMKAAATGSVIDGTRFHVRYTDGGTNVAVLVDLQSESIVGDNTLEIKNIKGFSNSGAGLIILRSATNASFQDNEYGSIVVEDNTIDRLSGSFVALPGSSGGQKIKYLRVNGNVSTRDNPTSGSIVTISRPVVECQVFDNWVSDVGSRQVIISSADRVLVYNNRTSSYNITNDTNRRINGLSYQSSSVQYPWGNEWKIGDIVDYNDTTFPSNSGVFIKKNDGTFVKISNHNRPLIDFSGTNSTPTSRNYAYNYIYFTGSAGSVTINQNIFTEGDELLGEIEGGAKTFVAGTGVTLRYPEGQGLVAPTGSRFIVKFKSANDALVTIIKPAPNASTTDRGIVELATNAETIAGTDTERAVTPAGLAATILKATATLDFPSIPAGESATLTATVTGAAGGDPVIVGTSSSVYAANDSTVDAWVSSTDTVTVRVRNNGTSAVDPGLVNFNIRVFK